MNWLMRNVLNEGELLSETYMAPRHAVLSSEVTDQSFTGGNTPTHEIQIIVPFDFRCWKLLRSNGVCLVRSSATW